MEEDLLEFVCCLRDLQLEFGGHERGDRARSVLYGQLVRHSLYHFHLLDDLGGPASTGTEANLRTGTIRPPPVAVARATNCHAGHSFFACAGLLGVAWRRLSAQDSRIPHSGDTGGYAGPRLFRFHPAILDGPRTG